MAKRPPGGVGRFESAHGTLAKGGQTLAFVAVPDGVRPAAAPLAEPIERDSAKRFTSAGAATAARRRWELAKVPDYVQRELDFIPTEGFAPFDVGRRELLAARIAELVERYGFVSPGVATVLRGWAWLVAFGEHAAVDAAKTGDCDAQDRARRFFKDASIELSKAWELARVEAASRPKKPADFPWLMPATSSPAERAAATTTDASSNTAPPSESNVAQASDMVNGPKEGVE